MCALLVGSLSLSSCARLHQLWKQPVGLLVPAESLNHFGARNDLVPGRLSDVWDRPLYTLTDPDFATRHEGEIRWHELWNVPVSELEYPLFEATGQLWRTPVAATNLPFATSTHELWNEPFFWRTQPSPEFVDPTPYRHWASQIEFPHVDRPPPPAEAFPEEPRRLRNPNKDEIWDLTLEQAIQIALANSHIIRSSGQFLSPANPLLNNPEFVPSSLDPAIQESGVLFGQRGIEAALSEFDAQFTTTMVWGRDEQIQNSSFGTGVTPGNTLVQETGNFSSGLTKRLATGGVIGVTHDWNYTGSNTNEFVPGARLFPSAYTGRLRVEARQPLWAGSGVKYTRIAGPVTEQIEGVTGVQQGVVIARINNDIELTEFEGAIRDLLRDVELLYWQLYIAYQTFDSEMRLLSEAVAAYRNIRTLISSDSPFADALAESDATELLFQVQARVDLARDNLYDIEAQLRRILGLGVNDGRVIRPLDEPTIAEFVPDWQVMLSEAYARRVELRRHKWNIKQLELQLLAAEHLVKPRLDLVAAYQVNAFGDDLLGDTRDGITQAGLGDAYATLTRGDQTGWNVGFEFSVPLGLRFAHTQVKNLEFRLAKAHAALAEAEKEVSHELADTFRELDRSYLQMQNNLNRKRAAARRVSVIEALRLREPDRYSEMAILEARDQLNRIEQSYLQSVIDYNLALMEVHYRGGTLLALNNVHLNEGPWDAEAEYDVLDRGYDRWHSLPTSTMLDQQPAGFVQPGEPEITAPRPGHTHAEDLPLPHIAPHSPGYR